MKKYYCVMQDDKKDCGVSCLLSIIRYYGGDASKEYLRDITNTTKDGVDAYSLMQGANELGFNTKGVEGDVFELEDSMLPCISHVVLKNSYQHFCVINKIDRKNKILLLSDPAQGIVKIKYNDYKKISTNQYLLLFPNKQIPKLQQKSKLYQIIASILLEYKAKLGTIFLTSILFTILNIIIAFYFQLIIDQGITNQIIENIRSITVIFLLFLLIKELMNLFRYYLLNELNCKLDHSMTCDILNHILSLPYLYYKNRTTGEIVSRINDLTEIRNSLSNILITLFVDVFLFLFVLITLLSISFKLTLLFSFFLFLYSSISLGLDSYMISFFKQVQKKVIEKSSYLFETIASGFTMKNLNIKQTIYSSFLGKYNQSLNSIYRLTNINNASQSVKSILEQVITIVLLWMGSNLVIEEKLSLSSLITYHGLIFYFFPSIKSILAIPFQCQKMKIMINRIDDLYKLEEEQERKKFKITKKIDGNITISKLSFSYGVNEILKNVNLSISSGEKVIISSPSGSGKSTLAKLLMGYMKIKRGMISIDGKDINDYTQEELRGQMAYVSQEEFLFTDSIYNNITLGQKEMNQEEFYQVCEDTKINEIILKNTLGYHLLLEENGSNLSGGEKERIILARALLQKRQVYILDEALSQVDIKTEREIIKKILKHYKKETFIFISHRFNNNDLFDKEIILGG